MMGGAESVVGLLTGSHTLLVGVEDDPDGGLRLYLGHRADRVYVVVDDPETMAEVRRTWDSFPGHITVPVPPAERLFRDERSGGGR